MDTTALLKASIEYEQSKTLNLLTHKRQDLSTMIEVIDEERKALEHTIDSRQSFLDTAEDIAEAVEADQRARLAKDKAKLESLLAWRFLFLSAWQQVKT